MAIVLKKKVAPAPEPLVEREPIPTKKDASGLYDGMFDAVHEKCGASMLIPWVLMASYAYYVLDRPLLSDARYDRACKQLLEQWDSAEHRHKGLIHREALHSGSLYHLTDEDYPLITKSAARRLMDD